MSDSMNDSTNPSPDDEAAPRSAAWRRRVEEFKAGLDQRVRQQTDAAQDGARAAAGHVRDLRGSMEELAGELTEKWERARPGGDAPDEPVPGSPEGDVAADGTAARFAAEFAERFEREVAAADDLGKAWHERAREFRDNTHEWADQFAQRWATEAADDEDTSSPPGAPHAPADVEPIVTASPAAEATTAPATPPTVTHELTAVLEPSGSRDEGPDGPHQLPAAEEAPCVVRPPALVAAPVQHRSVRSWRYGIAAGALATAFAAVVWVVLRPPGGAITPMAQAPPPRRRDRPRRRSQRRMSPHTPSWSASTNTTTTPIS